MCSSDLCGHRQLDAAFSDADLTRLYSDHYPRRVADPEDFALPPEAAGLGGWLDGARASAYRWVPPKVRVLDIGSGIGRALAWHRARGCDAWGMEADENVRAVAERHGLQVHIGPFDPSRFAPASFDWITLDQVIEHAPAPVTLLRGAASLLRPGGHLVLSTLHTNDAPAAISRLIDLGVPGYLIQSTLLGVMAQRLIRTICQIGRAHV